MNNTALTIYIFASALFFVVFGITWSFKDALNLLIKFFLIFMGLLGCALSYKLL